MTCQMSSPPREALLVWSPTPLEIPLKLQTFLQKMMAFRTPLPFQFPFTFPLLWVFLEKQT